MKNVANGSKKLLIQHICMYKDLEVSMQLSYVFDILMTFRKLPARSDMWRMWMFLLQLGQLPKKIGLPYVSSKIAFMKRIWLKVAAVKFYDISLF